MDEPPAIINAHEDVDLFLEALSFTSAQTGFLGRLIEKDYFCSVMLADLSAASKDLVFKGGTCLSKVHVGFYRLSEDLDFVIPMPENAPRAERSRRMTGLKKIFAGLPHALKCFEIAQPLTGAYDSTQYIGSVEYRSLLTGQKDTLKIEISLR